MATMKPTLCGAKAVHAPDCSEDGNCEYFAERAEAYAIGTRNGTAVTSEDVAYHNNSKYYSEQAATSATTATSAITSAEAAVADAETAQSRAEAAQTAAETAQTAAETAQGLAEDAQEAIEDMTVSAHSEATTPSVTKTTVGGVVNLDFGIPKGEKGDTGDTGATGATGAKGDSGRSILSLGNTQQAVDNFVLTPSPGWSDNVSNLRPSGFVPTEGDTIVLAATSDMLPAAVRSAMGLSLGQSFIFLGSISSLSDLTYTALVLDFTETTGAKGETGDDYVLTASDKSDIADIVLAELPTWTGGAY